MLIFFIIKFFIGGNYAGVGVLLLKLIFRLPKLIKYFALL